MTTIQKRRYVRQVMFIPAQVFHKKNKKLLKAEIEDLSKGGAYVRCVYPFMAGEPIVLEMRFAGLKSVHGNVVDMDLIEIGMPLTLKLECEVRWQNKGAGIGVEFKNVSSAQTKWIIKLVEYFQQMQKDMKSVGA